MVILKGKTITLRDHRMKDLEDIYKHINDYEIAKWFQGWKWPITRKKVKDFLKNAVALGRKKKPSAIRLAIVLNSTKEVIGCINFHSLNYDSNSAETGTWIGKKYWGQGINREAKRLLLDYGFKKLKLHRVVLTCTSINKRSKRAIEKLGAKKEAVLREKKKIGNRYYDVYLYSILKKEWRPSRLN
ncbi:GNAT family N-acetyltransferase [Candidatus Woesearchaeota archaeon]|nr:GNAT family N-acetyltransferase [Candidatus Woesearchaeota archaeon]MBW3021688.1 GNAT family N-acetyltransferase [Candidatus Woesearchaeota archaeon]